MGGDIAVDSDPGVGSTFTLTVELAAAPSADGGPLTGPLAGRRLLLVDDDRTHLELMGRQLSGHGAECVLLADPGDAARLDSTRPFDAGAGASSRASAWSARPPPRTRWTGCWPT